MGRPHRRRNSHWRYSVKKSVLKSFEEHLPTDASINEKQQETHVLLGYKNESYLVNLLREQ